jgi:hypothetical protein
MAKAKKPSDERIATILDDLEVGVNEIMDRRRLRSWLDVSVGQEEFEWICENITLHPELTTEVQNG